MSPTPDHTWPRPASLLRAVVLLTALCACASCLTFKTEVGLDADATQGALGFSPELERRMIFTYESRIYEEAGDSLRAAERLEKKLADYPTAAKGAKQTAYDAEKALVHNQLGTHYYHLGRHRDALEHYRKSLELSERHGIAHGIVVNSANIGQVALRMAEGWAGRPGAAKQAGPVLQEAHRLETKALALIEAPPSAEGETPAPYPHPEYRVYLRAGLAALGQQAAALGVALPTSPTPTTED